MLLIIGLILLFFDYVKQIIIDNYVPITDINIILKQIFVLSLIKLEFYYFGVFFKILNVFNKN